jgi:hypothetical protein
VLLGQLGRRRHLDQLGVAKRALGEGGEPAQGLDLIAEQVDPYGAILGRREQVEQAAADRELTAILDLVDALVAGRHQVARGLIEIYQLSHAQHERVWA